jgi:YVTN family beta-propeller protein
MKKCRSLSELVLRWITRSLWSALLLVTVGAVAAEAAPFVYVPNTTDVAGNGCNAVSVIDAATNTVVATVPMTFNNPSLVANTPDGAFAYVIHVGSEECHGDRHCDQYRGRRGASVWGVHLDRHHALLM